MDDTKIKRWNPEGGAKVSRGCQGGAKSVPKEGGTLKVNNGGSQGGQGGGSQGRECQGNIFHLRDMAIEDTKGKCHKVGLGYTKREMLWGSQGGHGGVLS